VRIAAVVVLSSVLASVAGAQTAPDYKTRAAELLGMSFRQLRYRVKKLGIE